MTPYEHTKLVSASITGVEGMSEDDKIRYF
jgi:hypothetical protein